jgi:2-polyprenyl-3-methyl-5-hydroxy-6-metoxy-1,4-benzoquinol methylase
MTHTLFTVFPKSGTGLIMQTRGIHNHIELHDKRGEIRTDDDFIQRVLDCPICVGHVPYSPAIHAALKRDGYRVVFIFRNLRDVVVSLANYVRQCENSELNVMPHGVRISRSPDPILDAIDVVAQWWKLFEGWLEHADSVYTYRELRGAALLIGHEEDSFTFAHGNINDWRREFQPRHIEAARAKLPDVLRQYNLLGYYEDEKGMAIDAHTEWEGYYRSGRDRGQTDILTNDFAAHISPTVLKAIQESGRIVDMGCGTGEFTRWMQDRSGGDVVGVDVSAVAIQKAREKFPTCRFETASFWDMRDRFDLLASSNTLEHFTDWQSVLTCWLELAPLVLIVVPYKQEHFIPNPIPIDGGCNHLTRFGDNSFSDFCVLEEYKFVSPQGWKNGSDPKQWVLLITKKDGGNGK